MNCSSKKPTFRRMEDGTQRIHHVQNSVEKMPVHRTQIGTTLAHKSCGICKYSEPISHNIFKPTDLPFDNGPIYTMIYSVTMKKRCHLGVCVCVCECAVNDERCHLMKTKLFIEYKSHFICTFSYTARTRTHHDRTNIWCISSDTNKKNE